MVFPMNINRHSFLRCPLLAVAVALVGLVLLPRIVGADVDTPVTEVYTWTAPTEGTAVAYYMVQIMVNDVDIVTLDPVFSEEVSVVMQYGNKYRVRVAGVDAAGHRGPYSPWSIPYTPELDPPDF
ncbi:hypothetical protein CSB20_00470 [bacterium DOLZORAL124_64_63]|nr:MAG: hypothetical protein CSB20_00470 [bacterium DOLZORAL124_64_63]